MLAWSFVQWNTSQDPHFTLAHHRVSSSSVVEHPTRSRRVVGSNPIWNSEFFFPSFSVNAKFIMLYFYRKTHLAAEYIVNGEIVKSVALLNLVPSHRLVRTEINFLSHSCDRPTIEESFSKMGPTKLRNLARVLKEKKNNEYENQIEVL